MLFCITNFDQIGLIWCKERCSFHMRSEPVLRLNSVSGSHGSPLCNLNCSSPPVSLDLVNRPSRGSCCFAHISKSCPEATLKLTAAFPTQPPFPLLLLKCPISGGGRDCTQSASEICCGNEVLAICFHSGEKSQPASALLPDAFFLVFLLGGQWKSQLRDMKQRGGNSWQRTVKCSWFTEPQIIQPNAFSFSFHLGLTALPKPNTSFSLLGSFTLFHEARRCDVTQATPSTIYALGNQTLPDGLALIKTSPSGVPLTL